MIAYLFFAEFCELIQLLIVDQIETWWAILSMYEVWVVPLTELCNGHRRGENEKHTPRKWDVIWSDLLLTLIPSNDLAYLISAGYTEYLLLILVAEGWILINFSCWSLLRWVVLFSYLYDNHSINLLEEADCYKHVSPVCYWDTEYSVWHATAHYLIICSILSTGVSGMSYSVNGKRTLGLSPKFTVWALYLPNKPHLGSILKKKTG